MLDVDVHFFAYGTLKRGQCRERCWPHEPCSVRDGWTLGSLYDLGPYPAMRSGGEFVQGEVWSFHANQLADVLAVLDEIEGTNQGSASNLYDREQRRVDLFGGGYVEAYLYLFSNADNLEALGRKIRPTEQPQHDLRCSVWPPREGRGAN